MAMVWLLRLCVGLGALGVAGLAILAFFGFLVPWFDLLNHFQVLICIGLAGALVLVPMVFFARPWCWPLLGFVVLGVFASGATVVPEVLAGMAPRPPARAGDGPPLKLMTHNMFGLNYDMKRMAAYIARENPDIIAFQEYFSFQFKALDPLLKPDYPYSIHCEGGKRANIGLYSKIPFVETTSGSCGKDAHKGLRTARILARFTRPDGVSFSVMTTHLDWPLQLFSATPLARQAQQFSSLAAAVRAVPGNFILVGDFNSTPWSYAQRVFATRAGLTRQTHDLLTYPVRFSIHGWRDTWPFLPLDQIMTKGNIVIHALGVGDRTGSDHLPLLMTFSVPAKPAAPN